MKKIKHIFLFGAILLGCFACDQASDSGGAGEGGSLARFTIINDALYTVDHHQLKVFDISQTTNPNLLNTIDIGWNIETIYPYQDKLFIGSQTGMFIYDAADSEQPEFLSEFTHARSCDPVVSDGEYAYVTLRDGVACANANNQLDIVDVKDLEDPELLKSYPMTQPAGLAIDGNLLFICDGASGLKMFDVSDKLRIDENQLDVVTDIVPFDVIPIRSEKRLIVSAEGGLYQYSYEGVQQLELLSKIEVAAP